MNTKLTDQLTERQNKILDYIRYVTKVRNYPPSVREIGEAVGLSSSSTVHNHLKPLERRGAGQTAPPKSPARGAPPEGPAPPPARRHGVGAHRGPPGAR